MHPKKWTLEIAIITKRQVNTLYKNDNFYFLKCNIILNTMFPSIIEQIVNNSDHQIQSQLNDSKIITGFSYWTIEPFEDYSLNNRTVSPNWYLSSFNLGFVGTITISQSFHQNHICDNEIKFHVDFGETFWSKDELVGRLSNIYSIVADGKTHLDSVVEAVVKAILKALESFVKAVTELASKALNWIWDMINKIFEKVLMPILEIIDQFMVQLGNLFLNAFNEYITSKNIKSETGLAINNLFSGKIYLMVTVIAIVIISLFIIIEGFPGVGTLIGIAISLIISIIISAIMSGISFIKKSFDFSSSLNMGVIVGVGLDFLKKNIHTPVNWAPILDSIAWVLSMYSTFFAAKITAAAKDTSGMIGLFFQTVMSVLGLFMTIWILKNAKSGAIAKTALDMMSVTTIMIDILDFIISIILFKKTIKDVPALKSTLYLSIALAGISIGLSCISLEMS